MDVHPINCILSCIIPVSATVIWVSLYVEMRGDVDDHVVETQFVVFLIGMKN